MINTYIYNEKNKKLGFTFFLFSSQDYIVDYGVYDSEFDMKAYYRDSKSDIVGINLENFLIYCKDSIKSRTILIDEAFTKINNLTGWRVRNREKYYKFLLSVILSKQMMIDIVKGLEGKDKDLAMMMYYMLINFCEEEIKTNKEK